MSVDYVYYDIPTQLNLVLNGNRMIARKGITPISIFARQTHEVTTIR